MTIQAAAERLREHVGSEQDRWDVSREYLRLTDPTPLTPELLKRLGFEYDYGELVIGTNATDLESGAWINRNKHGQWFVGGGSFWHRTFVCIPELTTLGQLRMLCASLGVPLTEQPNG